MSELDPRIKREVEDALRIGENLSNYSELLEEWASEGLGRKLAIKSGEEYAFVGLSLPQNPQEDNRFHLILLTNSQVLFTEAKPETAADLAVYKKRLAPSSGFLYWDVDKYPDVASVEAFLKLSGGSYKGIVTQSGHESNYPLNIMNAVAIAREIKKKSGQPSQSKALINIPQPPPIEKPPLTDSDRIWDPNIWKKKWPKV